MCMFTLPICTLKSLTPMTTCKHEIVVMWATQRIYSSSLHKSMLHQLHTSYDASNQKHVSNEQFLTPMYIRIKISVNLKVLMSYVC